MGLCKSLKHTVSEKNQMYVANYIDVLAALKVGKCLNKQP